MTKLFMASVVMLFTTMFIRCDGDEGIYFTKDEIFGDINTGKKISIGNNIVSLDVGSSTCINVHGQSGNIKAVSSDASIATVEADNSGGYNDGHLTITIYGKSKGTATIVVTDDSSNNAALTVEVMEPIRSKTH